MRGDHWIPLDGRGEAVLEALAVNEHFIRQFGAWVRAGCKKRGETQMQKTGNGKVAQTISSSAGDFAMPEPPKVEAPTLACSKCGRTDDLVTRDGRQIRMCRPCVSANVKPKTGAVSVPKPVQPKQPRPERKIVVARLGVADAVQALRSMSAGEFLDLESGLQDAVRELHRAYRATQKEGEQS